MHDAVFVTALLITINSVLRPLSRFIDRRSLAVIDTHALYRVQLSCDSDAESKAKHRITYAIAARALVLREIRAEKSGDGQTSVIRAILESATHDANIVDALVSELRAEPWTKSVEWTETASEAE
jgi:putative Mg2+ transporter-C (MgtC) family protein